jgi:hypothetical protein
VEKEGMEFKKIRYSCNEEDTISIIGFLKSDIDIDHYPCKRGWVHFTKDWELKLFCLYKAAEVENVDLPKGSWIIENQKDDYITVVFPADTTIQGFPVRGGGGVKGARTQFYKSGELKNFFPAQDFVLNGIQYRKSLLNYVKLTRNGQIIE